MISIVLLEKHWGKVALGAGIGALGMMAGAEHLEKKLPEAEAHAERAQHAAEYQQKVAKGTGEAHAEVKKDPKAYAPGAEAKASAAAAETKQRSNIYTTKAEQATKTAERMKTGEKWLRRGAVATGTGALAASIKKSMPKQGQQNQITKAAGL